MITDIINSLLQRLAYFFSELAKTFIKLVFQALQWLADITISILLGVFESLLSAMPGFSSAQARETVIYVRHALEQWNYIFPIYESLICMDAILTWKILVGLRRTWMTIIWHSSNTAALGGKS